MADYVDDLVLVVAFVPIFLGLSFFVPVLPTAFFATVFLVIVFLFLDFLGVAVLRVAEVLAADGLSVVGFNRLSALAGNARISSLTASRTKCGNSAIMTADTVRRTSSATVADSTFTSKGMELLPKNPKIKKL